MSGPARFLSGLVVSAGLGLGVSGCITDAEERLISTALDCDDCQEERAMVTTVGWRAVPLLGLALYGPGADEISNLTIQFGRAHQIAAPGGGDPASYVNYHLSNYRAVYQRRAAMFLGDIAYTCPSRFCRDQIRELLAAAAADSAALGPSGRIFRGDVVRTILRQSMRADSAVAMPISP